MTIRTSVNLPEDIADELARQAPNAARRSKIVERALRAYFSIVAKPQSDSSILDAYADELNTEAQEVLEFQHLP